MIFATCSFQSGALKFAKIYGIATVAFIEGVFLYKTKDAGPSAPPPSWAGLPDYIGIFMNQENDRISCSTIYLKNTEVLSK
ncbi:MAG: hypothetical protein AXA67_07780 [Methylothermaceae bacteria B42]|nr:MAG: hypothetical protein AXA67_07780 [Methylothermaceae bacteria B42]